MSEVSELMAAALDAETSFTERPEVVPGDLRSSWRVALLLMLLDHCHGKSATMEQVHAMGWAMLDESTRAAMRAAIAGDVEPDVVLVRYDPAWTRAMDLAVGFGFAEWVPSSGRIRLRSTGRAAASALGRADRGFTAEREFLNGLTITQTMIDRLLGSVS